MECKRQGLYYYYTDGPLNKERKKKAWGYRCETACHIDGCHLPPANHFSCYLHAQIKGFGHALLNLLQIDMDKLL